MGDERADDKGGRRGPEEGRRGGSNSRFLDLEVSKVLLDTSSRAAHVALEQLLVDRVKERLAERLGARLDALAELAVDDLVADLEANVAIERRIEERTELHDRHLERLRDIFSPGEGD